MFWNQRLIVLESHEDKLEILHRRRDSRGPDEIVPKATGTQILNSSHLNSMTISLKGHTIPCSLIFS